MGWDRGGNFYWLVGDLGLEAPGNNGLEARWTHWLEASVTGVLVSAWEKTS